MAQVQDEDSTDTWKYTCLLGKFVISWINMAISKSFGVLIPVMIIVLSTNTRTLGFVCSMPSTWMMVTCPVVAYVMNKEVVKPRVIALAGAFLSSATLITAAFITSIPALGICLSLTGIGLSLQYLPTKVMLNEYFKRSYVLTSSVANIGTTLGAFVAPFIIERSLEAYGYAGAMLILAAITLHAIPASATLRKPRESRSRSLQKEKDNEISGLLAATEVASSEKRLERAENKVLKRVEVKKLEDPRFKYESREESLKMVSKPSVECLTNFTDWVKSCVLVKETLFTMTLPCTFLTTFCLNAWVLFLVPRAEWYGIPSSRAVFVSTIGGAGGMVGRVFFIVLLYFGANAIVLSCIFNIIAAVTCLADPLITTFPAMCVVAFVQGFCVFSCYLALSAFLKYSVSDENFTTAAGIESLLCGLGGMSGGFIAGLIKDTTNSFTTVFVGIGVIFCLLEVNAVLFFLAHHRKVASRI